MEARSDALLEQEAQRREQPQPMPQPPQPQPTPPPVLETPPVAPAPDAPPAPTEGEYVSKAEYEKLRQQHNSLQGMYVQSQGVIDELSSQVRTTPEPPPVPQGPAHLEFIKPEEQEEFGEDVLDVQGRVADGVAVRRINEAVSPIEKRLQALEHEKAVRASLSLWDRVDDLAPGAKELNGGDDPKNADPGWIIFLNGVDERTGFTRRDIGMHATQTGNVYGLSRLVQEYQAANGAPQPNPVASQVRPEVVSAAPDRTGLTRQGPQFKTSEINAFYASLTKHPKLLLDPAT